jgi:hypothetical protein
MFQFPKRESVTLPSVENWSTNTNILKLPPQAVFTRRRDKVGDDLQITGWIEDSGDRICEGISKYARGVNPMVSVSYSNYNAGTNGNPLSYSGLTEAKLPYRIMDGGAFRPPILTQEDLLPLSRLPRNKTSVISKPEFPNYLKKMENPVNLRQVKKELLQTSVRPTATYKIEKVPCHNNEAKYNIKDSLIIPVNSGMRTQDIARVIVSEPSKEINQDNIHAHVSTTFGSNNTIQRTIDSSTLNTDKYISEALCGAMHTNFTDLAKNVVVEKAFDRGIKDETNLISYTPNITGNEKVTYLNSEMELERKLPTYLINTNIIDPSKAKNIQHTNIIELESKLSTSAFTNPGTHQKTALDNITKRDVYLPPSLVKGGFDIKGFIPQNNKDYQIKKLENQKTHLSRAAFELKQNHK